MEQTLKSERDVRKERSRIGRFMKIHSILVIKGASNYNVVLEFANELIREWEKTCQVEVLDGSDRESYETKKKEILNGKKYDLIFSFNALAWEEEPELMKLLMQGKTIYATQLLDHPLHHHTRLVKMTAGRCVVFVPDYNHLTYLKQYYPNITECAFMPHGGSLGDEPVSYQQRKQKVVFMGTYISSEQIRKKLTQKGEFQRILQEELMHQLEEHTDWTMEQAFREMIRMYQMEEAESEIPQDLAALADADLYIRSLYREKVLRILLESGIAVDVYGDYWEQFICRNDSLLQIHPPCDFQEALHVMENAKIVLNVMPWFKAGSHERIFNALGCRSIVLTDESAYINDLEQKDGIVTFDLKHLEKLPGLVQEILEHPEESEQQAAAGYRNCKEHHLWKKRAQAIVLYIEQIENDTQIKFM